jgi:hypothetical protein
MKQVYPADYDGYTVEEVIEQAKSAKARHGYTVNAVICKTFYSANKFLIGFHFDNAMKVGDKGTHGSGSKFEVLAIV